MERSVVANNEIADPIAKHELWKRYMLAMREGAVVSGNGNKYIGFLLSLTYASP